MKKLIAVVGLVLLLAACGDISWEPPAPTPSPTPSATATVNPVPSPTAEPSATPIPSPEISPTVAPSPTPKPVPTATAGPTPKPTATVVVVHFECELEPSDGPCTENSPIASEFADVVEAGQAYAAKKGLVVDGKILDSAKYIDEVAKFVRSKGLCAINGRLGGHTSDDEVWVKTSNDASEHFDIVTAESHPWLKYAARCAPAKF